MIEWLPFDRLVRESLAVITVPTSARGTAGARAAPPSENVTVPVGLSGPATTGFTTAFSLTSSPGTTVGVVVEPVVVVSDLATAVTTILVVSEVLGLKAVDPL